MVLIINNILSMFKFTKKKRIGFTCGAMDLLHAGHVLMLEECKSHCDYLIVGLQNDPSIERIKNKPIQSLPERYFQLNACKYVDEIIPYNTENELLQILQSIKYDIRFIGNDWKGLEFTGHDLKLHKDKIFFTKREHSFSSSDLRSRIKNEW